MASDSGKSARQAEMLANRAAKNLRHLRKWARREGVTCYRLYDRDIPEVPLAIDWYDGRLLVAEFERSGEEEATEEEQQGGWLDQMALAVADRLEVPADRVHTRSRRRQRGSSQYQRLAETDHRIVVTEGGHQFLVNLRDYVDTGLFLDHRQTRARVASEAGGKRFLNLFCYTGAFTVYAAAAGATASVSVDLSRRYLDWAGDNLTLNKIDRRDHRLIRADVLELLEEGGAELGRFDLALLDPPTFSNSKKMRSVLDLQRDHARLINQTLALLRSGGVLYFSTNRRRFKLEREAIDADEIEDLGEATIPPDFRNRRTHRCFRMTRA